MCASKLRSLSMIKPSNLWCDYLSIFVASRRSFKVAVSSLSLCCNLFPVTSNALVFSVLMYILFSVDHFSIFSKSLERARVKEVILFQSALKGGWYRQHIYQWWSCSNVKAHDSQIGELKLDPGLIPAVPLAWQVSAHMLYALASQTFVALSDTIETRPPLSRLAPYTDNFFSSGLWLITSNALRKSTNTVPSVILIKAVSVEWPERIYSRLFSWRYFNSEFARCFSMILDRFVSTDMGW